jgi:hypothetical protein
VQNLVHEELDGGQTISEIGAKTLYPIHTEHPDLYKKVSKNMVLIEEGKKYTI